jgi:DNA polymerase III epsilon subunit family exonuclease
MSMDGSRVSLVQTAARLLRERPRPTSELAEELMKLSGNPGAAASVVRALLGPDPRFRMDEEGVWWLQEAFRSVGSSLDFLDYAVVDLETTGGAYGKGHRILEVAVVRIRDGAIAETFRTLVNPGRSIPYGVTRLTGITDAMAARAPHFDEIAEELLAHLRGRVFVAHNARFDWSFIRDELECARGEVPDVQRICTVRMSRKLLPALRRHHLDALSAHYGIEIHGRHRAYGDALATARILLRLLDEAGRRGIADLHALVTLLDGAAFRRKDGAGDSPSDSEDAA